MRIAVALLALIAATAAVTGAARARATAGECDGLLVCVPVVGPWVRIPAPTGNVAPPVEYELRCPVRGYVVGGNDARTSTPLIAVSFQGETGSPVGPGVTTGSAVVFLATYGGGSRAPTSFRPSIGCVPASGGGGPSQVVFRPRAGGARSPAAFPPSRELDRKVVERTLTPGGEERVAVGCVLGARLVHATHAVGFRTSSPPVRTLLESVAARQRIQGETVVVTARTGRAVPRGVRVELQVQAVCTPGVQ